MEQRAKEQQQAWDPAWHQVEASVVAALTAQSRKATLPALKTLQEWVHSTSTPTGRSQALQRVDSALEDYGMSRSDYERLANASTQQFDSLARSHAPIGSDKWLQQVGDYYSAKHEELQAYERALWTIQECMTEYQHWLRTPDYLDREHQLRPAMADFERAGPELDTLKRQFVHERELVSLGSSELEEGRKTLGELRRAELEEGRKTLGGLKRAADVGMLMLRQIQRSFLHDPQQPLLTRVWDLGRSAWQPIIASRGVAPLTSQRDISDLWEQHFNRPQRPAVERPNVAVDSWRADPARTLTQQVALSNSTDFLQKRRPDPFTETSPAVTPQSRRQSTQKVAAQLPAPSQKGPRRSS
jgi:hypothetical protein